MRAALLDLLWLMLYVTVMRLLGYRIRRAPSPRATARTALASTPIPAAPAKPRRTHRYIDRQMCLDLLAGINSAVTPATPPATPQAAKPPRPPAPIIRRALAHSAAARAHPPAAPILARRGVPSLNPRLRAKNPDSFTRKRTSNSLLYRNKCTATAPCTADEPRGGPYKPPNPAAAPEPVPGHSFQRPHRQPKGLPC
jgi:hypothetical protein